MHLRRHIILGIALTAIAAGSAQACPNHATKTATAVPARSAMSARTAALVAWRPRAWAPAALTGPQAQGLRIAIDPVDGAMGMPAADPLGRQVVVVDGTTATDGTPVQVDRAPDGTLTAHLDERWADFAVATIGPDGKPGWSCVHGTNGAARFMKHPVVPVVSAPVWEDK